MASDSLSIDDLRSTGELAAQGVDAFVTALNSEGAPPSLDSYLPDGSRARRRLILIELIKVELRHRIIRKRASVRIEEYLDRYSELRSLGVPIDLVMEEYRLRQATGEAVQMSEYMQRFPDIAPTLARLVGTQQQSKHETLPTRPERVTFEVGETLGEFRLQRLLGRGAFAHVYLAWQTTLQRTVALKVARNRGTEPQTLAQLDHPHIVRVFDLRIVAEQELSLLSMKFVPGGTLDDVITAIKTVPKPEWNGATFLTAIDAAVAANEVEIAESDARRRLREMTWPQVVCWLGARVAKALQYAHERGVLHRDIKPANILLTANGEPQLADFNVSAASLSEPAPAAIFGGSLPFMSPEQLEVMEQSRPISDIDERSDIYSLGMTLWKLLAGERPFDERHTGDYLETLTSLIASRREGPGSAAESTLPANCPRPLVDALKRCLAGHAADRFQNAGELATALELCLYPDTQELLLSQSRGPVAWVRRFPTAAMLPMGLAPNIVASILNIHYNQAAVINARPDAQATFERLMIVFNGILFPLALFAYCWFAWPVSKAMQQLPRANQLEEAKHRCLRLGIIASRVCVVFWCAAGVLWPLSLDVLTGWLPWDAHLHFLGSLVLCGLIAAVYPFFLVTYLSLRALLPPLLVASGQPKVEQAAIAELSKSLGPSLLAAAAVPLLGVAALIMIDSPDRTSMKWLIAFGLIGCVFAYVLERRIRRDLAAISVLDQLNR